MPPTAERLHAALAALPVVIDEAHCRATVIDVPSYPDEPRPTSIVTLSGGGTSGVGEHVGWTTAAHAGFRDEIVPRVPCGAWQVGTWAAAMATVARDPYERAALEAAVIDLALRQAGTSCFGLVDQAPRPVQYLVSFDMLDDPVAATRCEPDHALKLDADPSWSEQTLHALAACGRVAVVDWKTRGEPSEHLRLHDALPTALIEDPGSATDDWPTRTYAGRVTADGWLRQAADLEALPAPPAAVNLKAGRMGGVLEMLACAAAAQARGLPIYMGGMFELGPGRRQLQTLAALLSPDGPNDVAPIALADRPAPRPPRLVVDPTQAGFGAEP